MLRKLLRPTVVLALIVAMPAVMNPAWSATSSPAALAGRVFGEDARTPVAGAVVKIQAGEDGEVLSSKATDADGTFRFDEVPPGDYGVVIETDEGAYKADSNLTLQADSTRLIQMSIRRDAAAAANSGSGGGSFTGGGGGGGARKYAPFIGFAAVIIVGVLGTSGNDRAPVQMQEPDVSPSFPGK